MNHEQWGLRPYRWLPGEVPPPHFFDCPDRPSVTLTAFQAEILQRMCERTGGRYASWALPIDAINATLPLSVAA